MARAVIYGLLALLIAAVAGLLWFRGEAALAQGSAASATARADAAEAEARDLRDALATERQGAQAMSTIGKAHEADRSAAERVPAAVVAGLRSGDLQLRQHWAACETGRLSDAAAAAAERDAAAERREADFGHLVRVGRDADDQLLACQAVVRQYADGGLTTRDGAKP